MILFALLSAVAGPDPFLRSSGQSYQICVETQAKRLSKSRETAPVVADAAIEACRSAREKVEVAIAAHSIVEHPEWSANYTKEVMEVALAKIDERVRTRAIFVITDARSK